MASKKTRFFAPSVTWHDAIVIVCVLSGIFMLSLDAPQHPETEIVRTESAYVPRDIYVPLGTTVTFTNLSPRMTWPASDLHPQHSLYSAFDPKRPLAPLESWSFTFDQAGAWAFHDHLEAHIGGTIHVIGEDTCSEGTENSKQCWAQLLNRTLTEQGLDAAFDALHALHTTHAGFARICHDFAHDIGLKTFALHGTRAPLTEKTRYCNAGFFHGFMEGFLAQDNDAGRAFAFCRSVGESLADHFPLAEGQCVHGIGHGALEALLHEDPHLLRTPERMLRNALTVCNTTPLTRDFLKRCSSGIYDVFRTWADHAPLGHTTYAPDRIFDWCTIPTDVAVKEACYHEMGKLLMRIPNPEKVASVFDFRKEIAPSDYAYYAPIAARAFAVNVGKRAVRERTFPEVIAFCRAAPTELQRECIGGLFDGVMFAGEPNREFEHAARFCDEPALTLPEQKDCYKKYEDELFVTYDATLRSEACATVPRTFAKRCTE